MAPARKYVFTPGENGCGEQDRDEGIMGGVRSDEGEDD